MEHLASPFETEENSAQLPKKKVTLVIPLGLPGMGKSTFNERILMNYFSQYNMASGNPHVQFVTISNDEIRQQLIDEFLDKNQDKTRDQGFLATHSLL